MGRKRQKKVGQERRPLAASFTWMTSRVAGAPITEKLVPGLTCVNPETGSADSPFRAPNPRRRHQTSAPRRELKLRYLEGRKKKTTAQLVRKGTNGDREPERSVGCGLGQKRVDFNVASPRWFVASDCLQTGETGAS